MPKGSSCKARGCTSNKTDNPELSFHSFPKNKERFKIWCDLIKRPDLNHSKVITNRMSMRVCSLHFEDRMYMSPNNKSRLIWCAVPKPVTDGETSNLAESVDSKAALANKVEAQERQTDSTVLAQPLPLAKGSKKFDWSLTLDEDVIVKEENMMDQDNQLDLSAPPSPEEANSPTSCVDTKEGIIKHDHTGRKCLENMKSSSQCQEDTTTVGATFGKAEASEPNETETESSSFISADGFNHTTDESSPNTSQTSIIPKVPSGESRESSPTRKNGSSKGIVYEAPSSLLSHVKEEPFRSTRIVLDNDAQVQKVTSKTSQLLEDTEQHCYPHLPRSLPTTETCQPITSLLLPNTVTTTASATTTTSSQSNSSVSATITQPPQQKITLSPSLGNFHSHKTVDSSMKTKEPKLIQVKSSVPDTGELSANREELLKKLAYDACGDEQPIVVDEDDVSIVDEREFSECEKDCQCIKCEEKAEKVLPETAKPPYQVRRTYSGPIKRKIVKTKDGGKRTFMILNKASLKVLQAKGLIQPLKNFADSQPPKNSQLSNQGAGKTSSSSDPLSPDLTASIYKAFPITPAEQKGISSVQAAPYKSANKELKKKYARLLNKHRQRYHLLLKKYKSLESKFAVVEDAGTPEQVIRDAKNFLSEEHVLFLESQMFLRNRPGTGNRFSKKFMKLMIEYYKRSAAGYRFLRTIFTIPSVKTVQKWLSKPLQIREEKESDPLAITSQRRESGTRNERESSVEASGSGLRKHQSVSKGEHGSGDRRGYSSTKFSKGRLTPDESDMEEGSSEEYDSEESGLEEMEDEEGMEESENSSKRLTGQTSHGSNEEEITIEWEEEPWPSVVME
ncbi:uncharacterized protein LOC121858313 isoform X2 [Homarus americanus]|uniref:uncharacterized protein LOC121858313 isoform X2 n=1 Tax=Homarus americanus TaxID=6706 RepID=UPI001C483165|nr:uncharacterized protein LOC121858313 isoform X2 [Homarus americanus]